MHLVFRLSNFIAGILVGLILSIIALPTWKGALVKMNQSQFSELTFYCDNAMRGHLLAKQRLVGSPSNENVTRLKSAEIDLLQCQDYDLMRKRLIRWGLTENELSEMSLLAIEQKGQDLRDVIKVHEIRY